MYAQKKIELGKTPLYELHIEYNAKMSEFAGYNMPINYTEGVLKEHRHTRNWASLFDVSHMGQIIASGNNISLALESLVPSDIVSLKPNRQKYSLLTNDNGGIIDDLIITKLNNYIYIVVNAAQKESVFKYLYDNLSEYKCAIELIDDRALVAIQGPAAETVMSRLNSKSKALTFLGSQEMYISGVNCIVSRCGYTGEDGFEISMPSDHAINISQILLEQPEIKLAGLAARDTLRLEAGLCLYGQDIDTDSSPVEAGLEWAISKSRRPGNARPGGYPGSSIIENQLLNGTSRKLVGLRPRGRSPVRAGTEILDHNDHMVGNVTSGGFGPSVNSPIAMGYVSSEYTSLGTQVTANTKEKQQMVVSSIPFVPHRYYRG